MLAKLAIVFVLFCLLGISHGQINSRPDRTKVRNLYAFIADKGLISPFAHQCIDNSQKYVQQHKQSASIETLIDLIERLEDVVANTSDYQNFNSPDKVARMILQRFHMDSVDFNTVEQDPHVSNAARIDTEIIGKLAGVDDYYFPDYVYNNDELCSMLFMFSHFFLNTTADNQLRTRFGRATYQFQRSQTNSNTAAAQSQFLDNNNNQPQIRNQDNVGPIQEKGIVSYRQDKKEAIAPAKLLMGIIAGLTSNVVLSGKAITNKIMQAPMEQELTLKDPVLAVTFGNLLGTASFYEFNNQVGQVDQNLIYGVEGTWVNETCCTYYATSGVTNAAALRKSNRGSLAQIRGALDGYSIGRNLKNIQDIQNIRLSAILKSYYSYPRASAANKLGLSYCDRRENTPNSQELNEIGITYNEIYKFAFSMASSVYKGDGLANMLNRASSNLQEFCNKRPSGGNSDTNAPCETPSDLIFVIDPKSEEITKTAQLISEVVSRINKIGRFAGAVSVFANSNSRSTNVEMPSGPGGWPLPALVWNSTNTGSAVCQLIPETPLVSQTQFGKYLHNVNQTIFNYKWWTRRSYAGVPSKNVIMIDYGSFVMPTSGADYQEFTEYRESLKWRNRDVKYLVVSPKSELYKDFVREDSDIVNPQQQASAIAATFADKICKNPATLTYNDCAHQASQNFTYEGFITPGYYQSWAVYPEYFKVSSSMEFKIKAMEGGIRYCYDRVYPTVKTEYCKDLPENAEDSFKYWGPCSGHSVHTCSPLYITVWGKERTTPCKDVRCQSLDQIKFSIGHTGMYCNSAIRLTSAFVLQMVCFVLVWMYNFKTV